MIVVFVPFRSMRLLLCSILYGLMCSLLAWVGPKSWATDTSLRTQFLKNRNLYLLLPNQLLSPEADGAFQKLEVISN